MNKRLREIMEKNVEFEKETPYNFCDRWCERCSHERQMRCRLYLDEFEQKITCIAHGRDPDDPEITVEVIRRQYEELDKILEEYEEELDIDFDAVDDPEFEKIKAHIKFVENNPLPKTAEQYFKKADKFLKETFYKKENKWPELNYDFKTVVWYHTLLSAKLQRALAGFHEPACEGEFALYDAVAQFEICKKAIQQSIAALQNINGTRSSYAGQITVLIALLHNIHSRIVAMEESI